jgi:uncharacterized repeat protein (TIGR04076 family)
LTKVAITTIIKATMEVHMAIDPGIGDKIQATVVSTKGRCSAGHKAGDVFEISYHDTCGLCGAFYHNIFPSVCAFQFGGSFPWFKGDEMFVSCPDPNNTVTMKLTRSKR